MDNITSLKLISKKENSAMIYLCDYCKTENNKWNKLYYQTDGKMLRPVIFYLISFCTKCNASKISKSNGGITDILN